MTKKIGSSLLVRINVILFVLPILWAAFGFYLTTVPVVGVAVLIVSMVFMFGCVLTAVFAMYKGASKELEQSIYIQWVREATFKYLLPIGAVRVVIGLIFVLPFTTHMMVLLNVLTLFLLLARFGVVSGIELVKKHRTVSAIALLVSGISWAFYIFTPFRFLGILPVVYGAVSLQEIFGSRQRHHDFDEFE